MSFGYLGDTSTKIKQRVKNDGVLSIDDVEIMDIDDGGIDMASGKTVAIDGTDISALSLIDEDDFATDSATRPPSQQSVKAYIANQGFADIGLIIALG